MVRSDSIANDPAKEKLCAERAHKMFGAFNVVPFEIDPAYVTRSRSSQYGGSPDVTFIAIETERMAQLVQCAVNSGNGRFEPVTWLPEQQSRWHLIKPRQAPHALSLAGGVCSDAARAKINLPNFDHSSSYVAKEVNLGNARYHIGELFAGVAAERYDIAVSGTALYKASGPDLKGIDFTCLLSPMLDVKAIQLK